METDSVPIIDIGPLLSASCSAADKGRVASEIGRACRESGFFYVENHGVDQDVVDGVLLSAERFFDQPPATKDALQASNSPLWRGYISTASGFHTCTPGTAAGADRKESFTVGAEGAGASPMHGANQWPGEEALPGWEAAVRAYWEAQMTLARVLARGLAMSLGLDEGFFDGKLTNPCAQMVLLKYPAPPTLAPVLRPAGRPPSPLPSSDAFVATGCGAHTDCGFLTILCQSEDGLDVKHANGTWVAAPKLPGTLVVNLGDLAQRWTSDAYKSTWHRVHNRSGRTRYSVPFFCNCDFDSPVECIADRKQPLQLAAAAAEGAIKGAAPAEGGAVTENGAPGEAAAPAGAMPKPKYEPTTAGVYIMEKLGLMRV